MGKQAFTLIELLVVIAIIGLLAGLLLPALSGAYRIGKEAACLSNQRQIMVRTTCYANDSNDFLLPSGLKTEKGNYSNQQYAMFLAPGEYSGGKNCVAICPEDQGLTVSGYQPFPAENWSVISENYLSSDTDSDWKNDHPNNNQGATGDGVCYFLSYQTNGHVLGKWAGKSPRLNLIGNPGSTFLFCDGYSDDVDMKNGSFRDGGQGNGRMMNYVTTRHKGGVITCYLDGAVRKYTTPGYPDRVYAHTYYQESGKLFFSGNRVTCKNNCGGKVNDQDPWGYNTGHSKIYCSGNVNFAGNPDRVK